jgi:hypothetical protein
MFDMTAPPPEDEQILALRRDAQRRLEAEERAQQVAAAAEDASAELRHHADVVTKQLEQSLPVSDLLAHEFEVRDVQAEARYQRGSYTFLGLSILMLTFFVGYGARGLLLQSLTVSLLLLMSGLAGIWSLILAFEKYKRGMLLAEHIMQVAEVEELELKQEAAIEAASETVPHSASAATRGAAGRTKASRGKATHIHFGHKSGVNTGRTQYRAK